MRVMINGQRWRREVTNRPFYSGGTRCLGKCYYDRRLLRIRSGLSPRSELGTDIHEAYHALAPYADEQHVRQVEKGLTDLLWRLGYRKVVQ